MRVVPFTPEMGAGVRAGQERVLWRRYACSSLSLGSADRPAHLSARTTRCQNCAGVAHAASRAGSARTARARTCATGRATILEAGGSTEHEPGASQHNRLVASRG